MKAVVNYDKGPKKVKIMDMPMPVPAAGQVRIKVSYAGVCGTDIHIYTDDGGFPTIPPVTLGHEFSGVVESVGEGVDPGYVGKRVMAETYYHTCGTCMYCRSGLRNLCPERRSIGSAENGAMAEYVVVPVKNVHVLPDNVTLVEAAMTEPLACCARAILGLAGIVPGDTVLIVGPGTIGLMCMQLAKLCGGRVLVAGTQRDEKRLELAQKLGADEIIYSDRPDARDKVLELAPPFGPDVVADCSGAGPGIQFGLDVIRKGGRYVQVGLTSKPMQINMNQITLKELSFFGSNAQNTEWFVRSLELMRLGKINLKELLSTPYEFEDWETAFQAHIAGVGYKHVLKIDGSVE